MNEAGQGVPVEWMDEAARLRSLEPKHILFLCVANSARSQMAEALARSMCPEGVTFASAGSEPSEVRPEALAVLGERGIDASAQWSKSIEELDTSTLDAVITLCSDEVCPVYLGDAHRLDWELEDPAGVRDDEAARLDAFRATRDELERRFTILFAPR